MPTKTRPVLMGATWFIRAILCIGLGRKPAETIKKRADDQRAAQGSKIIIWSVIIMVPVAVPSPVRH